MAQAQTDPKTTAPLGVQAAAAATTPAGSKPAATPAAAVAPGAPAPAGPKPEEGAVPPAEGKKSKNPNKLFIVTGEVHSFDTFAQAEKFLNGEGAPASYSVLRGKQMKSKQKVSLR